MCRAVTCPRCDKASWAGCGQHVNQVLAGVPQSQRCRCTPAEKEAWRKEHSLWRRLFGRSTTSA